MKSRILLVLIVTALRALHANAAYDSLSNSRPTVISLKTAIDSKMLEIRISGSYNPRQYYEVAGKDGVHYGKCMEAILKSKLDSTVIVRLESGTLLIPADDSFQKMLVTKEVLFPLFPERIYRTRFYAMCSQMHRRSPFIFADYTVGELADSSLVKLARNIDETYAQNMIAQHALWAYTDSATYSELVDYGADSNTILSSIALLNEVNLHTALNPAMPPRQPIIDNDITLNRYWVYGGIGTIALLSVITGILAVKGKKRENQPA